MHIKKIALHAMVLGMTAVAVMATDQSIDLEAPCTIAAIVANWGIVRVRLTVFLASNTGLAYSAHVDILKLLNGDTLPVDPDMELLKKVFDISGTLFEQLVIGGVLANYWAAHPCVNPTPTLSSSVSSVNSSSTDTYSTESSESSSSDIYSISSSESSSSDIDSSSSSDSSSSDIYSSDISSSYVTTSVYSSTFVEPTSTATDIYSSAPTSLYSTIPPHKCYIAVVVTSQVTTAYSAAY
ncbi:hypothetical protein H4S07_004620 [Coemansia furcata]|uniref:Uncharacterized protein n=1 Tax=Coemansia furcata TaxID=417177 RepID=A0ACC1L835_9FUNG|nr:hypothetical protein H4S07_004620 [Coemansia furcata]